MSTKSWPILPARSKVPQSVSNPAPDMNREKSAGCCRGSWVGYRRYVDLHFVSSRISVGGGCWSVANVRITSMVVRASVAEVLLGR